MQDDFDDPTSGFHVDEYAHGHWRYEDGVYSIEVRKDNWIMHTSRGEFTDFAVDLDVTAQQPHGCSGLVFRLRQEGSQYYLFTVCADGRYSLEKLMSYTDEEGEWETLRAWETSTHVRTGAVTQHLRVISVGNAFWLYVNDQLLAYVQDEDAPFDKGALGMQVTNPGGEGTVRYTFDHLRVYVPGE
jgi:hypothetical protein